MNQGITVNIGNYQSIHLHSSEYDTVLEVYQDLLDQVLDWVNEFDAMIKWRDRFTKLIKAQG